MNTKYLMVASSVVLGLAGLAASFAPVEILNSLNVATTEPLPVLIQLLGALYLGFALLKYQFTHDVDGPLIVASILYTGFVICFGYLVFGQGAACATNPE